MKQHPAQASSQHQRTGLFLFKHCLNMTWSHTDELDLGLVVAADDRVGARRLAPVQAGVLRLHLGDLQLHLVVFEPHHRDVAGRHALADGRVRVARVEGGDYLGPRSARLPGCHPLKILQGRVG